MIQVPAVYENGVLRPTDPVRLSEGQQVLLHVYPETDLKPVRPPTAEEEEYARRLRAAKSLAEMYAVMATAPPAPDFDVIAAVNESRRLTGFRMPDPDPTGGEPG